MARYVKILGFAASADAGAVCAAMAALPGPAVLAVKVGGLAVLAQHDGGAMARPPRGRRGLLLALRSVQTRLEAACQLAPFLPADPAQCRCLAADAGGLLAEAIPAVSAALAGPGQCHQWDVVLTWQPEDALARRRAEIGGAGREALAASIAAALANERAMREAGLRAAIGRVALAVAPAAGGETQAGLTVLVPARGEAVLEQALGALPAEVSAGASADLRGPLPPLSFAAVRVAKAAPGEVAQAWQTLALPGWIDADGLRRHWRECAARLHPDHGAAEDGPMVEAGAAFRLLRGLLPDHAPAQGWTLAALQRRGAGLLRVPAP